MDMNLSKACEILEISRTDSITVELIKSRYRKKALKYHPDKNRQDDAHAIFQELNEAYHYMLNMYAEKTWSNYFTDAYEEDCDTNYASILLSFLKGAVNRDLFDNVQTRIFHMIINKIATSCETKVAEFMERLDKEVLIKIHNILKMHIEVFHFSEHFLVVVENIIQKKMANDERIILYTFLDDLFADNLYRLKVNANVYIIPLWSHELVYDNNGNDLFVECVPILPENISIDEVNNLHVDLSYSVVELLGNTSIQLDLGNRTFFFDPSQLKLCSEQLVVLANQGLSKINTRDIYDVQRRADIYLHITLTA